MNMEIKFLARNFLIQRLMIFVFGILMFANVCAASTPVNVPNLASLTGVQSNDLKNDDADGGGGGARTAISVGDFNGDGKEDVLVGAPGVDGAGGRAYLIVGSDNKSLGQSLNNAIWFYSSGPTTWDTGASVALADLDGDGFDDVVIGDPQFGGSQKGEVYIFFGSPNGFTPGAANAYQVNNPAAASVTIRGTMMWGWFGQTMAKGDFNHDGYDDIAVQERYGTVYLILGRPRSAWPQNTVVSSNVISNTTVSMFFGMWQQELWLSAGDIDGDNYDDLVVGDRNDANATKYLFYGRSVWPSSLSASMANAEFRDTVANTGSRLGNFSMDADVNADGIKDLLIETSQKAFLLLGKSTRFSGIYTLDINNTSQVADAFFDFNGGKVFLAKDLNGDRIDDVVLYQNVSGQSRLNIYFGKTSGWSKTQSVALSSADAVVLPQSNDDWEPGVRVAAARFDGNLSRPAQLVSVATFSDPQGINNAGQVYLTDIQGMVMHFSFNAPPDSQGKIKDDSVGGVNKGAVVGPVYRGALGKFGGAYEFDGVDDYIIVPASSSLNVGGGSQFSWAAWFQLTHTKQSPILNWMQSLTQLSCPYGDGAQMWLYTQGFQWSGKGTGANLIGGDTCNYYRDKKVISTANQPLNEWHHLVITYDMNSGAKLYLDGVLKVENPGLQGYHPLTDKDLFLGISNIDPSIRFKGLMDEVRIYNRVLSSGEITNLVVDGPQ